MYHEWAYGARRLTFGDRPALPTVDGALAQLAEGQSLLQGDLDRLTDADLAEPVLTNWGEQWPAWRIFWTMIDHDAHHGGEVGCLRDLYRVRAA